MSGDMHFGFMPASPRRFQLLPLITEALEPPPPSYRRHGSLIQLCPEARAAKYCNSTFPSLLQKLGPNTRLEPLQQHQPKRKSVSVPDKPKKTRKPKLSRSNSYMDNMRRRNESHWLRIEELVKEKVDTYERYAAQMERKVARQRQEIQRRTELSLEHLARLEEQKKQERLFHSPHGRMWRHHRSLQRRALDLEPMTSESRDHPHIQTTTDSRHYPRDYIMTNFLSQLPLEAAK